MNPFLRGLRMAGDSGDGPIRYWLVGIVDFCCVLLAFERYDKAPVRAGTIWLALGVVFSVIGFSWPRIRQKLRRSKHATVPETESPLAIIFDSTNPARRFWSMESVANDTGGRAPFWEYRVEVKNNSMKTLRNASVTTERLGSMPARPFDQAFDK